MRKLIKNIFIVYIGVLLFAFNPAKADNDVIFLPTDDFGKITELADPNKPLIEADNELIKFYAAYKLINLLYPDKKIDEDIVPFLRRIWPTVEVEKLAKVAPYFKFAVMVNRRYTYVVNRLKQRIKANSLLPSDAPIVAADGEFATFDPDDSKTSPEGEYKVSYTPYKYLEYDSGELGEPVRRRDKNYEEVSEQALNELTLGLLEFDIPKIFAAIKKMPKYNDGTREKNVDLENNIKSRLMIASSGLGEKEEIEGIIEILLPQGWYINGDYLNPRTKPKFFLTEDKNQDSNIKSYQIFYPEALGVESNNKIRRILINNVRFPLVFSRRNLNKGINIKSEFVFELCQAKTDKCHPVISRNSLSVKPSEKETESMHSNYVYLSFAKVPQEQTKHVQVKKAYYNSDTKELTVKFNVNKTFSNLAAMAEDAVGTDFVNPKYTISDDEITATFQSNLDTLEETADIAEKSVDQGGEIAITAAFDEYEVLRAVITPEVISQDDISHLHSQPDFTTAFLFGLLINLMPGLLYIMQRLLQLLTSKENRREIIVRYAIGCLGGWLALNIYTLYHPWYAIYENVFLFIGVTMLITSYLMHLSGYMDFALFRPLKGKVRRGYFLGLSAVLLICIFPFPYKAEVFNNIVSVSSFNRFLLFMSIFIGMMIFPLLALRFYHKILLWPQKLRFINLPYTLCYILPLIWISYQMKGMFMLIIMTAVMGLTIFLWRIYPFAVITVTKQVRRKADKQDLFDIVQKHASVILIIIWLAGSISAYYTPSRYDTLPDTTEVYQIATEELKSGHPTLFMLSTDWSWTTLYNHLQTINLHNSGVAVIRYTAPAEHPKVSEWLKKYKKISPPLNILFTQRHPEGIALPEKLKDIDWVEAIADLIPMKGKK